MNHKTERQGEIIIIIEAILWSLMPVLGVLALQNMPALSSLAWGQLFAGVFFAIVLWYKKKLKQIFNKQAFYYTLYITIIAVVIVQGLYFYGLKFTTPGNASLIFLTEAFFSYLLFNVWQKKYMPRAHVFGAILMVVGAAIVLLPNTAKFQVGDFLILLAAAIIPLSNHYVLKARKLVDSETILLIRSALGVPILFALSFLIDGKFSTPDSGATLIYLILIGFVVLGISKILWFEGIHRINVAKANGINGIAPLFTMLLAWIFLQTAPTSFQLIAFVPIFFGIILISRKKS